MVRIIPHWLVHKKTAIEIILIIERFSETAKEIVTNNNNNNNITIILFEIILVYCLLCDVCEVFFK